MKQTSTYIPKALLFLLLLTSAALCLYGNARLTAAVLCCAVLCVCLFAFHRHCRLGERISVGSMALIGYTVLYAASCLLGPYGSESLPNTASLLIGTTGYLLLLAFCGEKMTAGLPAIFSIGSGAVALLSLDASTTQLFATRFLVPVLAHMGGPGLEDMQYEAETRIVGVVGGSNVLAGLLGIGTLLSLYVLLHTRGRHGQFFAVVLMFNAAVFFLAFSMGALCAFALAAAAYLICSPRGERGLVFLGMAMTAVLSLLCGALMTHGLGRYGSPASYFALLCPLAFGAVLAFVFPAASAALTRLSVKGFRKKLAAIAGGLAAAVLYAVLAATVTTPITLTPWATERDAYLAPGDYTLYLTSDEPVKLLIASQSRAELLNGEYNYLYDDTTLQAAFNVPEASGIVRFSFTGSGRLYQAAYTGGQKGELRMNSPLVPAFVEKRLQGVFFSKNILERLEMCRDGLKLFASSPVFGCGAGAFEAKTFSIQQHYYETKYVHNQYIQCLVDTGVVGLALFLLVLGTAFRQIARQRNANPALSAAVTACLVMAAVHGLTEVVWSMHAYVLFLFALLAMCELAFPAPLKSAPLRTWVLRGYTAVTLGFSFVLMLHLFVQAEYQHPPENGFTPERIAFLCEMEPFSKEIYQLDYVCNYGADAAQSGKYLAALRSRKSYDVNMLLLQYVYLPAWDMENIRSATREAYWDRHCDAEAVDGLYSLLASYHADKLFSEESN